MKQALFIAVLISLFSLSILSAAVSAGSYMDFHSSAVVEPGQEINFTGSVYNSSNLSQIMPNINITAAVNSTLSSIVTSGSPASFNVTAPNATGEYNVTIYSNDTNIMNKTFTVYVSNVTGGSIVFTGKYPPFSAGSSFTINVTLKNAISGNATANYVPNVSVFSTNGGQVSWNIANLSVKSDANGVMIYNVAIPSGVDGQYVIVVERGVIYKIFSISAGYVISTGTEDTSGAASSNFAQNSTVNIVAKVRDSSGNPITNTSNNINVTAYITLPNSTVINRTLLAHPDSAYAGYYNTNFNIGAATGDIGQYNIKIVAGVAGKFIDGSTLFNVKTFTVKLEMQKEFFEDWGGQAAFESGKNVSLNIVPVSTSDSSIINSTLGTSASLSACNSTYLQLVDVFYANGTSINGTMGNTTFGTGRSMATSVCKISFTAPSESGTYGMRVNVTISNITVVGETYFSVQKVMMKAASVSDIGGSMDFKAMVTPGENVSVSLTAYSLSSKSAVSGINITNITVTRIVPLEFTGGASEYTDLTEGNNYTVTAGTTTDAPIVSVTLPSSVLGPTLVEIRANISGEIVTGSAFFMANYLMGFLQPQMGSGREGGEMGGGGSSFSSCEGTVTFSGSAMEVKSSSAAQGVAISSIVQARDELTGRDVSSLLRIAGSTTSAASTGVITVNVTFNPSYSFSGFYFMVFNASYQGKTTGLPAGFMCKKLNFWPQIMSAGGDQQSWRIAPTGGVNITIGGIGSEVTRLNDSKKISNRSYVTLPMLMNFNPSKGGMSVLVPVDAAAAMRTNFSATDAAGDYSNITTNKVTFVIYPSNFSMNGQTLTRWPNGFIDLQPVITSEDIGGASDIGMGGFEVVPFDAYTVWSNSNQVSAGDNKSYTIYARTNVSNKTQPFSVSIGRPWEGQLVNVSNLQYVLVQDEWNTSTDWGNEQWQVNFTIPSTMKKGGADLSIEVNNTAGDKSTVHMWLSVVKYSVVVPSEEGMQFDYWNVPVQNATSFNPNGNASLLGWNMTYLRETYNVWSKINITDGEGLQTNGSVMIKNQFNASRYGMGQPVEVVYNPNISVLLLDNTTAGVYDTLILKNATNNITIVNLNQRSVLNFTTSNGGRGGIYLWSIEGGYVRLINSSATSSGGGNSWGGSYQKNTSFKIPYVVKLGGAAQQGASLSVNSIGVQQDGGGNGGFGFSDKLISGQNYTSSPQFVNTDANGVAFVDANISKSGKFIIFWKVNTSDDSDVASMDSGTQVEAKSFQTDGGLAYNVPMATVVLEKNVSTTNIPNSWIGYQYLYNGTVAESGGNDFVRDDTQNTWFIIYNPFTNQTIINNALTPNNDNAVTINKTTGISQGVSIGINKLAMNTSADGNVTMQFYDDSIAGGGSQKMVSSQNENVTVKVCANSFDKPDSKPKEGATFYLYVRDWSNMGPSTTKNLMMIDFNGTQYNSTSLPRLGPKGCFALNVTTSSQSGYLSAWSSSSEIQGSITYGADTESVWAGQVFYNQWQ